MSIEIPCKFDRLGNTKTLGKNEPKQLVVYTISFNETLGFQNPYFTDQTNPYPINMVPVTVKRSLDESIINYFKEKSPSLKNESKN